MKKSVVTIFLLVSILFTSCDEWNRSHAVEQPPVSGQSEVGKSENSDYNRIVSFLESPSNLRSYDKTLKFVAFYKVQNEFGETELKLAGEDYLGKTLKFSSDFSQVKFLDTKYNSAINNNILTMRQDNVELTFDLYFTKYGIIAINRNAKQVEHRKLYNFKVNDISVGFIILAGNFGEGYDNKDYLAVEKFGLNKIKQL